MERLWLKPFFIFVKTNMPKTRITNIEGNSIKLDVHAIPEKGKANLEIIKFFKKEFKKNIEIISGHNSKKKLVKVIL